MAVLFELLLNLEEKFLLVHKSINVHFVGGGCQKRLLKESKLGQFYFSTGPKKETEVVDDVDSQ
jgi:hypothetical protein